MGNEPKTVAEIASMGGKAAAKNMTAEERALRASQAATARWSANLPRVVCGSDDRPLRIGEIEIPCYVLDDSRRVIAQRGFQAGIGMNASGGARRLLDFLGYLAGKGVDCKDLESRVKEPVKFITSASGAVGVIAHGYEASALADMCDVILDARKGGHLLKRQEHYADFCEVLLRGFARVGIIALVDAATGYEDFRERDALTKILEAFIAKELQPYIRAFEPDYYKAICRLKGWKFTNSTHRPRALAQITNDIVYSRLAPGVLDELREKNPVVKPGGRRGAKHFQWLTENKGNPDLRAHLQRITGWMEMSATWEAFYRVLNDKKPPYRAPRNRGPGLFDELPDEPDEEAVTLPSSSSEPPPPAEQSPTAAPQ